MKIAFVSSEVAPLSKTGGLADVAGALPRRLFALGHDIHVFTPLHSGIDRAKLTLEPIPEVADVPVLLGSLEYRFSLFKSAVHGSNLPVYLIQCPAAFDRATIYTTNSDEHLRFLLLQRAVFESCQRLQFAPDILHCNDWHTGLMPLFLRTIYAWDKLFAGTRSLMSIHNIGYQGQFASTTLGHTGLADDAAKLDPAELASGHLNWLKEGIRHADRVATVSPTYAQEICGPIGGHGLDGALRARTDAVAGILNGVDYDDWNPKTDKLLVAHYDATDLSGKAKCKRALLERANLQLSESTPLIGMVSRLTPQKGFDLLFDALPEVLEQRECAVVALGSGEARYEEFFRRLAQRLPERVHFVSGYSEELAHWIEAGSDMFLMPSMYEPCGLNQMYSLKYGTIPIVRRTGGLADSVAMWNDATGSGTGVVFDHFDAQAVRWALHTALDLFKDKNRWRRMMQNGMARDFSWDRQAGEYEALYRAMHETR